MRRGLELGLAALVSVCLFLPGPEAAMASGAIQGELAAAYANSSWAIGVVVPEGAGFLGGNGVHWEGVNNVTASLVLPDISSPDRTVYAILSVMTSDGSVLQAAAGAVPNRTGWFGFAWLVQGADSGAPTYVWVLNASGPAMSPGTDVSISLFHASGAWSLRVTDVDTGLKVVESFPAGPSSTLKVGDQEVFALESYSRNLGTFSGMGNLTLNSLWLNGKMVASGCYLYADWDMVHNPLFVVGSSGSSPPSFMNAKVGASGSYVWSYSGVWGAQDDPVVGAAQVLDAVALAGAIALVTLGAWWVMRRRHSERRLMPEAAS